MNTDNAVPVIVLLSEVRESVARCLEDLQLTDFAAALEGSELSSQFASPDEELTVFAPTNEAINGRFLGSRTLNAHVIADDVVRNNDLRDGAVLRPLDETTLLHVTDEHDRDMDYTEVYYNDSCELHNAIYSVAIGYIYQWSRSQHK